uniref:Uncharacterized protein n=1 Tax=Oryza barthii TaxID=65489 RepID=A0A0D3GS23_9ORYZ
MRRRSSLLHAVLLAVAAVALPLAAGQPWPRCGTGGTYAANSTYETNLLDLISALQGNASSSPTLYASGVVGSGGRDAVYGVMLCRGDLSTSDCNDCGTRAGQDVGRACNRTRVAALVYNQCYVRVSDADFLAATTNNSGEVALMSSTNITRAADVRAYDAAVVSLLNATVRYAVENSTRMFATGQRVGADPGFPNLYATAQCAFDITLEACRGCLEGLVARWWDTFPVNVEGARIAGTRCNLRSELNQGTFYTGQPMVVLRADGLAPPQGPAPAATTGAGKNNSASKVLVIVVPIVAVAIVAATSVCIWNARKKRRSRKAEHFSELDASEDLESVKSTLITLASLQVATDNFHESKKLGEGGFGAVYKGLLFGQEVAVKRLAKGSNQGLEELKNELVLVAKLHHKNLVRLVGFCLEEGERLLVYEYMPNKSLDIFLFDSEQSRQLDWVTRFKIIEGIARGLQYLHQDSQKKIVHRDMKASNVLLDADMNPKIGDFGLARLFGQDQTRDVTNRIVGTFGYMSPEYVIRGQYSTKSDVFSFGILVIEIVTGRRNSGPHFLEQNEDLISIVRRHWEEGNIVEMIDHSLGRNYPEAELLKCVNIGLLCVQQNPVDRPTMADVMVLLNSDATSTLPAFATHSPTISIEGNSAASTGAMRRRSTFAVLLFAAAALPLAAGQPTYGLILCRGDVSSSDCYDCGTRAGQDVAPACNRTRDAILLEVGGNLGQVLHRSPDVEAVGRQPLAGGGANNSANKILEIVLPIVAVAIVAAVSILLWNMRKKRIRGKAEHFTGPDAAEDFESVKSTLLSLASLQVATDNFNESMKLGEGGFGAVYKGLLFGQDVAVKRLAKGSNQGLEEVKNELVLVAKLHHKNLVQLVGFCLEEGERMLVYEYMPNKSLDIFLFDEEKRRQLDWTTRFRIIEGIARGLHYLHQDSQKNIVHRDMEASNILLDADMNPKIGDFGLARLFGQDQTREITNRIVRTFGYMSPEYVMHGQYSTKSDVFSFGILVIEIVWRHWAEGNIMEMIDPCLGRNYPEMLKCASSRTIDATSTLPAPVVHIPAASLSDGSCACLVGVFLHAPLATDAQPMPWHRCNATSGNYTANSTYHANIQYLATSLPAYASSSPSLFASGSSGAPPDAIYALALCRGDTTNASSCATCVAAAIQAAQKHCALVKTVTIYDDPCIVRFSSLVFPITPPYNTGMFVAWDDNNVSAAAAASVRRFGTGALAVAGKVYPKIYSLAQCTPDMSADDCRSCLEDILVRMVPTYLAGRKGGRVVGVRCNFRFETYPFFFGQPLMQLPGSPASSSAPVTGVFPFPLFVFTISCMIFGIMGKISQTIMSMACYYLAAAAAGLALLLLHPPLTDAQTLSAQKLCPLVKTVIVYDDTCILRFSNKAFPISPTSHSQRMAFEAAVVRLINSTVDYAATDSVRRFGTGEEAFDDTTNPKIYSLAQCTPDMTATDCRSCLEDIVGRMVSGNFVESADCGDFFSRMGGRVFGVRCNFRFEVYPFFTGRSLLQLPGPSPSPAPTPPVIEIRERSKNKRSAVLPISVPTTILVFAIIAAWFCSRSWRRRLARKTLRPKNSPDEVQSFGSLVLDLQTIRTATDNFSEHKRLGEGGFGVVYKGDLPEGQEIAVKRLAQTSRQGIEELKTELLLVAKLNHNNLVRLIGVCLEENEKILAYEYMPNRSLDTILFDAERIKELDWGQRFKIINGIARGLQYLHEDSQLKIVHRDLKASNVLLDSAYNPKISDFGLAKIFERDQSQVITHRIAGTYGYMSPEYAMHGQYSIKSDVYSFGVLVLEIIAGRRNFGSYGSDHEVDLIYVTWEHWTSDKAIELIDPSLGNHYPVDKVLKCIHIGLLCVQPKPADRPLMSAVNAMLSSTGTVRLPCLSRPSFWVQEIGATASSGANSEQNPHNSRKMSQNEQPITELEPRWVM